MIKKNEEQLELELKMKDNPAEHSAALLRDFGQALFAAREELGVTKAALGKSLGVDGSSIGHWERGEFQPSQACLEALLKWRPRLKKYPLPTSSYIDKPPGWPGSHEGVKPGKQPATKAKPNRVKIKAKEVDDALVRAANRRQLRAEHRCTECGTPLDSLNQCVNRHCKVCPLFGQKQVPVVNKARCSHCGLLIRDNGPGKGVGCSNTQCKFFVGFPLNQKKRVNHGEVCAHCDGRVILGSFVHTETCDRPEPRTCSCGSALNAIGKCTRPGCTGATSCCRNPFGGDFCSNPDCVNRLGNKTVRAGRSAHRLLRKYSAAIGRIAASHALRTTLVEFLQEADAQGMTLREVIEVIEVVG